MIGYLVYLSAPLKEPSVDNMLLEIDVTTFKLFHFEHFETPMSDYSHQGNTDRFLTLQDLKLKLRIFLFIFFAKSVKETERDDT